MSKVVSIKPIGIFPVYNMVVDEYHNYITANGVILKNCDALRYYCQHRPVSAKLPDMRKPEQKMLANAKKAALGGNRRRAKW